MFSLYMNYCVSCSFLFCFLFYAAVITIEDNTQGEEGGGLPYKRSDGDDRRMLKIHGLLLRVFKSKLPLELSWYLLGYYASKKHDRNTSHTHKTRFWYLLGVPFKISMNHPRHVYMGVPPDNTRGVCSLVFSSIRRSHKEYGFYPISS